MSGANNVHCWPVRDDGVKAAYVIGMSVCDEDPPERLPGKRRFDALNVRSVANASVDERSVAARE
jgi:hypothetical protein